MKNILILLFLLIQTALAADISENWYTTQEEKLLTPKSFFPTLGVALGFKSSLQKYQNVFLESAGNIQDKKHWHWSGINTSLALGASGDIGILSFGGQQMAEFFWIKKSKPKENLKSDKQESTYEYSAEESGVQLNSEILQVVKTVAPTQAPDLGQVSDIANQIHKILSTCALQKMNSAGNFEIDRLRIDFTLSAEGKLSYGPVVSVGGDLRFWIDWKIKRTHKTKSAEKLARNDLGFDNLVNSFSESYEKIAAKLALLKKFQLNYVRLGLAFTAQGNIGVAKVSFGPGIYLYLKHLNSQKISGQKSTDLSFVMSDFSTEERLASEVLGAKIVSEYKMKNSEVKITEAKISPKKIQRLLLKGIRLATKIDSLKEDHALLGLRQFRVGMQLSASGGVYLVNLKATPSVELEFKNFKF